MKTSQKIGWLLGPSGFIIILLLPQPEGLSAAGQKTAACAFLMAVFWVTETIPMAITSLLPLVLFPVLKIADSKSAAAPYANHLIFLFLGGFIIALSIEKWNLHKRIALTTIKWVGSSGPGLLLGFMGASAFLSMWISNTATAMMMLPIALAVGNKMATVGENKNTKISIGLMLGIAYGASIGGAATLIGTPPNIFWAGYVQKHLHFNISFISWMLVGLPLSIIMLILTWLYLWKTQLREIFLKPGQLNALILKELKELGPISKPEKMVLAVFTLVALCWVFQGFLKNWISPLMSDATIAIFGACLLFILPVSLKKQEFLMVWEDTISLPWGVLILFGGGLSLANAFSTSNLTEYIGAQFSSWNLSSVSLILLAIILTTIFLTEVTSNTATASMLIPIMAGLGYQNQQDSILFTSAVALAASYAFMLPIATPPNAVIFSSGHVSIKKMASVGFALNLLGIFLIFAVLRWLAPIFWKLNV